jgi:hypothetical protein
MELVVEKISTAELMAEAEQFGTDIATATGSLMRVIGEIDRREAWRAEGATSLAAWVAQRLGVSEGTGRLWAHVAERLWDLPHLAQGLRVGAVSFDKVRPAVDVATPETDAEVLRQAQECSVRQLADLARAGRGATDQEAATRYDTRYLRFNDTKCTLTAQLPEDLYAGVRGAVTAAAKQIESDGETRWDQRLADGLVQLCRLAGDGPAGARGARGAGRPGGAAPAGGAARPKHMVVAHTDLALLRGGTGTAEIERLGLLSPEAIRRIACDAEVVLAVDDAFGHTMFEGRAHRFPTDTQRREIWRRDRRCRFPGCANATFTDVHHIVLWTDHGPTDLNNLVTLCDHHHHRVHEKHWKVKGNANGILRFNGPSGRTMSSRPSPLWTRRRD